MLLSHYPLQITWIQKLKVFIIGQPRLPDSPFDIADHSLKEAVPEQKRGVAIVVMVVPKTHKAHGVLKEVKMAQAANKHIVQLLGIKMETTQR